MDPYLGGIGLRREPPSQNTADVGRHQRWRSLRYEPYSMDTRPSFGLWLKITWLDILTMLIVGAIALGLYSLPPPGMRMFPLTVIDARTGDDTGEVVYPQFAYPYRPQIISSWLDTVLAILIPLFFLVIVQIRVQSFWDLNNFIMGFIYALETSSAFQVMIKWLIGGLRPSFYDICKPDPSLATNTTLNAAGYRQYMYTSKVCSGSQGRPLWNAMQSFPSGHSTTICAAAVYIFLYLNAKLKVFANYHSSMWKLVLLYCPILGAVLVCGSLTVDESHNWYDILAGAIIGIVFSFSAYRMVYASIWDWRVNHIPLNRSSAFVQNGEWESSDLVFTNRAGWRATRPDAEKETLPGPATRNENRGSLFGEQSNGNTSNGFAGPSGGGNDPG
ncbi:acid phosphatase/Vanadium-dependent haloperoxidase [Annulohypoxylon maeteangense]|uniref:acid phosphatase/Vanadium-dependent haloperoxidase n=1 Tax=Annulohypoxylon maeteangense TaxID=1927788 RepID=UPI002008656B|nr:acid phosphatase/Vanadium-dependent haloperoxidase [Annulohypoxylon maeteangense]KAI0884773.1 acid phosphatase/Vanadium-dependent haloperoxidase [Annulohypoxylon maeteangense]